MHVRLTSVTAASWFAYSVYSSVLSADCAIPWSYFSAVVLSSPASRSQPWHLSPYNTASLAEIQIIVTIAVVQCSHASQARQRQLLHYNSFSEWNINDWYSFSSRKPVTTLSSPVCEVTRAVLWGKYCRWLNFLGVLIFVVFVEGSIHEFPVPKIKWFSVWILKGNTMATNFEPHKCVVFVQSKKIGTHENKAIHSSPHSNKIKPHNWP